MRCKSGAIGSARLCFGALQIRDDTMGLMISWRYLDRNAKVRWMLTPMSATHQLSRASELYCT